MFLTPSLRFSGYETLNWLFLITYWYEKDYSVGVNDESWKDSKVSASWFPWDSFSTSRQWRGRTSLQAPFSANLSLLAQDEWVEVLTGWWITIIYGQFGKNKSMISYAMYRFIISSYIFRFIIRHISWFILVRGITVVRCHFFQHEKYPKVSILLLSFVQLGLFPSYICNH